MSDDWRKELDDINAKILKRQGSDAQYIAANRRQTDEYRKSLSESLKGRPRSPEAIEKWRKSHNGKGENNSMYGKTHTEESRQKISEKLKGKPSKNKGIPRPEEVKEKMRKPRSEEGKQNMRKPRQEKVCPYCGFVGAGGIMLRWHFDNCKHK